MEYREHLRQNFVRYASEVMQLRALSGSPKVLLGMELDWFPSERPFMEAAVAAYPFDYIIGGIHFLGSWGFDFTQDDWKISPQQCYTRYENYFRTLADMARSGLVDIAAHPDIIKLYSVDVFHQWLAMPESLALISEALTAIRDNGLVMEISSAGLRKPCNEIYPCLLYTSGRCVRGFSGTFPPPHSSFTSRFPLHGQHGTGRLRGARHTRRG